MTDVECQNCHHPVRLHTQLGACTECATLCSHARAEHAVVAVQTYERSKAALEAVGSIPAGRLNPPTAQPYGQRWWGGS